LIQRSLEGFYHLEAAPDVADFVREAPSGSREMILVRQGPDGIEVALMLPAEARLHDDALSEDVEDSTLQVIEGVSHFLFLAERARTELPTTHLELELQAEVDKFVLLALLGDAVDGGRARRLHAALYGRVRYLHAPDSEAGLRYRLANDLAARLSARVLGDRTNARPMLQRFYRSGQAEKIRLATVA
jgi:hypothetical protein